MKESPSWRKRPVGQLVTRPGRLPSDPPVTIPIPEDLLTVPGIPVRQNEVDFYSREYPIESQNVDFSADRQWAMTVLSPEAYEHRKEHEHLNAPLVAAARHTGDLAPTATPNPELDPQELTELIRQKARDMGFAEVGFTYLNRDYIYKSKKRWIRFDHVMCLAMEQEYEPTQTIPSMAAEHTHHRHLSRPKGPWRWNWPTGCGRWGIMRRFIARMTTAGPTFRCSCRRGWGSWGPMASCSPRTLARGRAS